MSIGHFRYKTKGFANELVCVNGSWLNTAGVACVRVDCGKPVVPFAIVACPAGTRLDDKCTFKCKRPARKQGRYTQNSYNLAGCSLVNPCLTWTS